MNVEEQDIRAIRRDGLHGLGGATRLARDLHTVAVAQHPSDAVPHDGVIVNDQEPNHSDPLGLRAPGS